MDPNATIAEIRELVAKIDTPDWHHTDASRLCDLIDGLDSWLREGGLLPAAWARTEGQA